MRAGMIIGLGSDLIDIRRIEKTLARFGQRFLDRIFTAEERRRRSGGPAARVAWPRPTPNAMPPRRPAPRPWAPDFAPASSGATRRGQPALGPTDLAADRWRRRAPGRPAAPGMTARIDLTMTDEYPMAEAVVVISAIPLPSDTKSVA